MRMTPLLEAFQDPDYALLGQTTCLGTRTYLEFNKSTGWSLIQLNIIQRIFRWIFRYYPSTHLNHVYCTVSCELLRKGQAKNDIERIDKLRSYLLQKWPYGDWTRVPTDWRIGVYPAYSRLWNKERPGSFEESRIQLPIEFLP